MSFFDDAEKEEFKLFTPGYYTACITNASVDLTEEPGFAKFEYTVTGDSEFKGRKLWRNFKLDGQGKGRLITDLTKFGIDTTELVTIDHVAQALSTTVGIDINVKVQINEKKDKPGEFWTNAYLKDVVGVEATEGESETVVVKNHAPGATNPPNFDTDDSIPF